MKPDIRWLDSGEPFSEQFQDFYFSTDGGFEESEYVFLKQNQLPERFHKPLQEGNNSLLKIGETGFGTGLNCLMTLYFWLKCPEPKRPVHYISVEKFPFDKHQLERIYSIFSRQWPQLHEVCELLLAVYPETINLNSTFKCHFFNAQFKLTLLIGDAQKQLELLIPTQSKTFDVWYLDGFAPAKNPQMWTQTLFNTLFQLSKPGTTLSSFTAAGFVRRGLLTAGYSISKVPGLGKKRECIKGTIK